MLKAIEDEYLSSYIYYPIFISLEPDELEKYIKISKKLLKHYDFKNNVYRKSAEQLLFQRKNIVKKFVNIRRIAMSSIQQEIHQALEEIQTKLESHGELSANELEMLFLSSLIEEEA